MYRILVIDPDIEAATMIERFLKREGYQPKTATTLREAMVRINDEHPDVVLVEVGSADLDGLELCQRLRSHSDLHHIPVIMTGKNDHLLIARALEAGGDDFITKPISLRELAARLRAHLRRVGGNVEDNSPVVRLIPHSTAVFVDEREVLLTQVEYDLLSHLCRHPTQLHQTTDLLEQVWHYPRGTGDTALVRNHIRNLRRKIEPDPDRPTIVQSRHGRGYTIRAQVRFEMTADALRLY